MWDIPGTVLMEMDDVSMREILSETIAVVYVFTCQAQSFSEQIQYMSQFVELAYSVNSSITFEFLLHKWNSESVTDEKVDLKSEVETQGRKALATRNVPIDFTLSLTSIYDNSLYIFFSNFMGTVYKKSAAFKALLHTFSEVRKTCLLATLTTRRSHQSVPFSFTCQHAST